MAVFHEKCLKYFAFLTQKYRRAMWHPWESVPSDPYAPGANPAERSGSGATKSEQASFQALP
jgi:hypothetical protein